MADSVLARMAEGRPIQKIKVSAGKDGQFKFRRLGVTVTSSVPPVIGQWQQVVGTWDGTDIRIYVNGVYT